jgi:5-methylcytosine-specific restriction endonuclease McrA
MPICVLCKVNSPCDGHLIDGASFHRSCYQGLESSLQRSSDIEQTILQEIRKPLSFTENIFTRFSGATQERIRREKAMLSQRLESTRNNTAVLKTRRRELFDVWTTYPPDWDDRRDLVGDRDEYCCSECGVGNMLHLHHVRALHDGGTHRIENLILLCAHCHSQVHGGATFKEKWERPRGEDETSLQKKIALVQEALTKRKDIFFHYKKPDGSVTRRTVTPRELRKLTVSELQALLGQKVKIEKEGRLCLFGHCHLRKEKRTFALSRMYKIDLR